MSNIALESSLPDQWTVPIVSLTDFLFRNRVAPFFDALTNPGDRQVGILDANMENHHTIVEFFGFSYEIQF